MTSFSEIAVRTHRRVDVPHHARRLLAGAATLLAVAAPAQEFGRGHWLKRHAENERQMGEIGRRLGRSEVTGAVPVEQLGSDPTTSWRHLTQKEIANGVNPVERKTAYRTVVRVDYDGDGALDVARLASGQREGVVIITFGGKPRPPVVAYREERPFGAGEEIYPAGNCRIVFLQIDVHMTLLLMRDGRPVASRMGE